MQPTLNFVGFLQEMKPAFLEVLHTLVETVLEVESSSLFKRSVSTLPMILPCLVLVIHAILILHHHRQLQLRSLRNRMIY